MVGPADAAILPGSADAAVPGTAPAAPPPPTLDDQLCAKLKDLSAIASLKRSLAEELSSLEATVVSAQGPHAVRCRLLEEERGLTRSAAAVSALKVLDETMRRAPFFATRRRRGGGLFPGCLSADVGGAVFMYLDAADRFRCRAVGCAWYAAVRDAYVMPQHLSSDPSAGAAAEFAARTAAAATENEKIDVLIDVSKSVKEMRTEAAPLVLSLRELRQTSSLVEKGASVSLPRADPALAAQLRALFSARLSLAHREAILVRRVNAARAHLRLPARHTTERLLTNAPWCDADADDARTCEAAAP